MKQFKFQYAAVLACALLLCLALSARADKIDRFNEAIARLLGTPGSGADRVLEAQLHVAGFKYDEDKDGDFQLYFGKLKNGQSNVVVVDSHVQQLLFEKIRNMWTIIRFTDKKVTGEQALDLLRRNSKYKIGAWQVTCTANESECVPVFQIEIPGDASTSYLKMAVATISVAAEQVVDAWTSKGWLEMKTDL
jgi:hypothetical protein